MALLSGELFHGENPHWTNFGKKATLYTQSPRIGSILNTLAFVIIGLFECSIHYPVK